MQLAYGVHDAITPLWFWAAYSTFHGFIRRRDGTLMAHEHCNCASIDLLLCCSWSK
jgi:hypothetical protein